MRLTRRKILLGVGATTLGALGLEYASLRGAFDHRHGTFSARALFDSSIAKLEPNAIVHVGHSTHILSVAGVRMLTDPWFYDPAFGALTHITGPATEPDHIGDLDVILITHDHPDHADFRAIDRLDKRALVVAATQALLDRARSAGFTAIVLQPWESHAVKGATITAVPGIHDVYEIGFVVQGAGHSVYFAGDTKLFEGMREIRERLSPTMAILPVDGTRISGAALHVMTPGDALEAARILGVPHVMPSHAEAHFSDPFVKAFLASTIDGAAGMFATLARGANLRCALPLPGELVAL